jgi:hypothetical protein
MPLNKKDENALENGLQKIAVAQSSPWDPDFCQRVCRGGIERPLSIG